ncbi:MAG TPA: hypothetical protein VJJ70_09535 [Anaerolineales bacterium]|nr:hypothetical protein [Anaerolineales bacterium]
MNIPAIALGAVIATLYGALFYLAWPHGSYRRLLLCLVLAWFGFALGHFVGNLTGFALWRLGAINMAGATVGSLIALAGMRVLALREWK